MLLVFVLGAALAALWEIYEWVALRWLNARLVVGYNDAIGDMFNGALGSFVAGLLILSWRRSGYHLRADP